jgi:hypothetical protein
MTDEANQFGSGTFGTQFGGGLSTDVKTLIDDALATTGIGTNDLRYRDTALRLANQTYLSILKGKHWSFLNKELFIDTRAPFETGTIDVTAGSHSVSETSAAQIFNVTLLGSLFTVTGRDEYYRVADLPTSSEMTISPQYAGDTATDTTYRLLFDRILLDSKVQDLKSLVITGHREIKAVGLQQFREMKSRNATLTGPPQWFTIVEQNPQDGSMTVELYPAPDKAYSVHIEYTERPLRLEDSETCYMVIPPEHYDVILLALRAKIYQDQNNVQMFQAVQSEAGAALLRMQSDMEVTDSVAMFKHKRNYFNRRQKYRGYYGTKWFGKVDD